MLGRNTIGFVNTIYIYIKKVNGGPVGFSLFDLIRVGPSSVYSSQYAHIMVRL